MDSFSGTSDAVFLLQGFLWDTSEYPCGRLFELPPCPAIDSLYCVACRHFRWPPTPAKSKALSPPSCRLCMWLFLSGFRPLGPGLSCDPSPAGHQSAASHGCGGLPRRIRKAFPSLSTLCHGTPTPKGWSTLRAGSIWKESKASRRDSGESSPKTAQMQGNIKYLIIIIRKVQAKFVTF